MDRAQDRPAAAWSLSVSRNGFVCYQCRHTIAHIRVNSHDQRVLRPTAGTMISIVDDNRIILECGECHTVNKFEWRKRPDQTATLAGQTVANAAGP